MCLYMKCMVVCFFPSTGLISSVLTEVKNKNKKHFFSYASSQIKIINCAFAVRQFYELVLEVFCHTSF